MGGADSGEDVGGDLGGLGTFRILRPDLRKPFADVLGRADPQGLLCE